MQKVCLIGAGQVGGQLAYLLSDLPIVTAVYDQNTDFAKGRVLDIAQARAVEGKTARITSHDSSANALEGSHVVVVSAGLSRRPGMSRGDLLHSNAKIIAELGKDIALYATQAVVVVVTNPLDVMTHVMQQHTGFAYQRVLGMAGVLDSARMRFLLSQKLNISPESVDCLVMGGHGDTMVPVITHTTVGSIPVSSFVKNPLDTLEIINNTRSGGAQIVNLLQNGSASFAPAMSTYTMVKAILYDEKRILASSCYFEEAGVYIGVNAVLGKSGVESIIFPSMDSQEQQWWDKSIHDTKELVHSLSKEL